MANVMLWSERYQILQVTNYFAGRINKITEARIFASHKAPQNTNQQIHPHGIACPYMHGHEILFGKIGGKKCDY
jgi:hypothetical protein